MSPHTSGRSSPPGEKFRLPSDYHDHDMPGQDGELVEVEGETCQWLDGSIMVTYDQYLSIMAVRDPESLHKPDRTVSSIGKKQKIVEDAQASAQTKPRIPLRTVRKFPLPPSWHNFKVPGRDGQEVKIADEICQWSGGVIMMTWDQFMTICWAKKPTLANNIDKRVRRAIAKQKKVEAAQASAHKKPGDSGKAGGRSERVDKPAESPVEKISAQIESWLEPTNDGDGFILVDKSQEGQDPEQKRKA